MAVKKGGLGKGLDSLIPSGAPKNKKNITEEKTTGKSSRKSSRKDR